MRPVQITYDPPAMPHVCIKCGSHAQIRDYFVDIGTEVEWEGYIYLCNSCIYEIVKVTPDFLTLATHQEIVAEYKARMQELTELKEKLKASSELWFEMTGNSLEVFMDNLAKVKEYGAMELSRTVSISTEYQSTVVRDSPEPESSDYTPDEPIATVFSDITFA
jgi:hypothetical protein